ncbi:MAG: GTPase HflX [Acidobacteria bacterium]|nr:GTPase HflX [Acidobacteriota bacterium]
MIQVPERSVRQLPNHLEVKAISNIEGNTQGLKPNQLQRIEKLYNRRIPPRDIVTQEFARHLSELSREINRQIGVLVNRNGYVEYVVVGNANAIVLPDLKRVRMSAERFRGLRCLHTHLLGEKLTQDDLTDLALLRLDLMAAIEVKADGLPGVVRAAHLLPANGNQAGEARQKSLEADSDEDHSEAAAQPWAFLEPRVPSQLEVDFLDLITSLEEELARSRHVRNPRDQRDRAILVGVTTGSLAEAQESLDELKELARSSDVVVLDSVIQRRQKLDPRSLIGRGKLEELIIRSLQLGVDAIIFDQNLSSAQVRVINDATDLKIIDRTQLILDIFAQRAQSREGKIQVELAQLKYMLPRLSGSGTEMSRLMGGIGGRGPGETKLEVDRRRVRDRIHHLEKQIEQLRTSRKVQRMKRLRREVPILSIVGYTNAGKSTLLNALTQSTVTAEDLMFATLDPTSRRLRLPREQEVVINDTVGFIKDLPPDLITAFRATLEEMEGSDLLIHLVDASNPQFENHIASVKKLLEELKLSDIPHLLVFNKSDLLSEDEIMNLRRAFNAVMISAIRRETLAPMLERIGELLDSAAAARTSLREAKQQIETASPATQKI